MLYAVALQLFGMDSGRLLMEFDVNSIRHLLYSSLLENKNKKRIPQQQHTAHYRQDRQTTAVYYNFCCPVQNKKDNF
jgi:hypothetical protein